MTLLAPWFLFALPLAALPWLLHLLRRRQERVLEWGAMHYLSALPPARLRLVRYQAGALVLLRCLLLALVVVALARPRGMDADATVASGGAGLVLLIDDSASAQREAPRGVLRLARALIAQQAPGTEISLCFASDPLERPRVPHFDHALLDELLAAHEPGLVASDHPALIRRGLQQASRHVHAEPELILITDQAEDGWCADKEAAWQMLTSAWQDWSGPPLLVVQTASERHSQKPTLTGLTLDRPLVTRGEVLGLQVSLAAWSQPPPASAVELSIDGRVCDRAPVVWGGDGQGLVRFEQSFAALGERAIAARLVGADTLFARRQAVVVVEKRLAVAIYEGRPGAADFLRAACDPVQIALQSIEHIPDLPRHAARCLVLAEPRYLDEDSVTAIEALLADGTGLLVLPPEEPDFALIDQHWHRAGDGFLPLAMAPAAPGLRSLRVTALDHPVLRELTRPAQWIGAQVAPRWRVPHLPAARARPILVDETGQALVVLADRGAGQVALMPAPAARGAGDWVLHPSFPVFVTRLISQLAARILPRRQLTVGDRLDLRSLDLGETVLVRDEHGRITEGVERQYRVQQPGLIELSDGARSHRFAVVLDPRECAPAADSAAAIAGRLEALGAQRVVGLAAWRAVQRASGSAGRDLWPALLALALLLFLGESWAAAHLLQCEQTIPAEAP